MKKEKCLDEMCKEDEWWLIAALILFATPLIIYYWIKENLLTNKN